MAKAKRRIPKYVGGVKIPKDIRRKGEALIDAVIDHARGPEGLTIVNEAFGAIFSAAMKAAVAQWMADGPFAAPPAAPPPRRPPPQPPIPPEPEPFEPGPPRPPVPPMPPAGAVREPDWEAIADTFGRNAERVLGKLFGGNRGS